MKTIRVVAVDAMVMNVIGVNLAQMPPVATAGLGIIAMTVAPVATTANAHTHADAQTTTIATAIVTTATADIHATAEASLLAMGSVTTVIVQTEDADAWLGVIATVTTVIAGIHATAEMGLLAMESVTTVIAHAPVGTGFIAGWTASGVYANTCAPVRTGAMLAATAAANARNAACMRRSANGMIAIAAAFYVGTAV